MKKSIYSILHAVSAVFRNSSANYLLRSTVQCVSNNTLLLHFRAWGTLIYNRI